jgi:hypothetical protein
MAIDPKELRVNYKDLLSIPIRDRAAAVSSGNLSPLLDALTPSQRAALFPRYYEEALPDVSGFYKAMSGGMTAFKSRAGGTDRLNSESDTYGPMGKNKGPKGQRYDSSKRSSQSYTPRWVTDLNKDFEGKDFLSPDGTGGTIGSLIASGEGGYNSYNRGRAGDSGGAEIDFSQMTLGEVMEKQSRGELFAVGKYQVIPGTMRETVNALSLDPNQQFTPELQERIFRDYLIDEKRPAIKAFVTGKTDDINSAQLAAAQEFASVEDPYTGRSHYDGVAGNSASISAEQMAAALKEEKRKYDELIASGLKPEAAWAALSEGNKTPEGEKLALMPGLSDAIVKQYDRLPPGQQQAFLQKLYKSGESPEEINQWVDAHGGAMVAGGGDRIEETQATAAATRKLPLDPDLVRTMNLTADRLSEETGKNLKFKVWSGGQAAIGTSGPRTGSTEHDLGGAGDGQWIEVMPDGTERNLSLQNEEDKAIMYRAGYHFTRAGGRSVGLENSYMGDAMHLGISRNSENPTHHGDDELAAMVAQGKEEFLAEAKEKGWDVKTGYRDYYEQEQELKRKTEIAAREQNKPAPITAGTTPTPRVEQVASDATNMPANRPFSLAPGSKIDTMKKNLAETAPKAMPEQKLEAPREDRAPIEPQPVEPPAPQNQAGMTSGAAPASQPVNMAPDAYSGVDMAAISPSQARAYNRVGENLHRDGTSFV